jgi:hypothetical protein
LIVRKSHKMNFYDEKLHSPRHTCVRRNITMVVRQEPQTKSTILMNE